MFRFRRLSLELDCAVETIVWDIFVGNWPCDVDDDGDLMWDGVELEDERGYEQDAGYNYGFEPGGDSD